MADITISQARKDDAPYIEDKLQKYLLDSTDAKWQDFFVAKENNKTVAFIRMIDHTDFIEIASLGVDYYHRHKGIGMKMLLFIIGEARRRYPARPIYGVTHRPGLLEKCGFEEVETAPQILEYKKYNKCALAPSKIKIMRLVS